MRGVCSAVAWRLSRKATQQGQAPENRIDQNVVLWFGSNGVTIYSLRDVKLRLWHSFRTQFALIVARHLAHLGLLGLGFPGQHLLAVSLGSSG